MAGCSVLETATLDSADSLTNKGKHGPAQNRLLLTNPQMPVLPISDYTSPNPTRLLPHPLTLHDLARNTLASA